MSNLTPEQRLASCAVEVLVTINEERLKRARRGKTDSSTAGIPWRRLVELADAVEELYPDLIDRTYRIMDSR